MESASRIVERTLGQNNSSVDILRNYKNDESMRDGADNQILAVDAVYEDESVRSRPVMSLQCSPHYSELFLAAYGAKGQPKGGKGSLGGAGDSDCTPGMVAVWSQMVRFIHVQHTHILSKNDLYSRFLKHEAESDSCSGIFFKSQREYSCRKERSTLCANAWRSNEHAQLDKHVH